MGGDRTPNLSLRGEHLLSTKSWYVYIYVQVDTFFIWPTTCWKYCIFNIDYIDAKMDNFARNRTLSHTRTNEAWISKRYYALFIVYIYICPYSWIQVMGLHANGGGLDKTAWMPFLAVSICWWLQCTTSLAVTTTVWIIKTAVSKSTWSMQIMPISRLIEPVARLSISCHLLYLFYNDWVIV